MTTFDQKAWAVGKKFDRVRRYRMRMEQQQEAEPTSAWLLAVDQDDADDDRATACTESPLEAR